MNYALAMAAAGLNQQDVGQLNVNELLAGQQEDGLKDEIKKLLAEANMSQ